MAGVGSIRAVLTLTPVLVAGAFPIAGPIDSESVRFCTSKTPLSNARQIAGLIRRRRGVTSAGE